MCEVHKILVDQGRGAKHCLNGECYMLACTWTVLTLRVVDPFGNCVEISR